MTFVFSFTTCFFDFYSCFHLLTFLPKGGYGTEKRYNSNLAPLFLTTSSSKNLKLKNIEYNICENTHISIFHVTDYNLKLNMGQNLGLWVVMADVPTPKMFNAFVIECMSLLRML